ncbi:hypothetical protein MRB53_010825, partial [Persea americana]
NLSAAKREFMIAISLSSQSRIQEDINSISEE